MSERFPVNIQRLLRNLALVLGGMLLFWLPVEDTSERWVILFAAAICSLGMAYWIVSYHSRRQQRPERSENLIYPLAGAVSGLAVTPAALFLMAFKSGLHGHSAPDFTSDQIIRVILGTPIWSGSGLLIGLGVALLRKIK